MSPASVLLLVLLAAPATGEAPPPPGSFEASVVSLTVTYQPWDQRRPWAKGAPEVRRALAVVVAGPYLLTTTQMVADATLIEVRKLGRSMRAAARVVRADLEVDLTLLAVDEPGFFDDLAPARLAPYAPATGTVESVRWRGRQIEVSTSRVSRTEVGPTPADQVEIAYLLVTTDLRGGGWSEPVFTAGKLVGLTVNQDEQTATVLPVGVIATFLDMARPGQEYRGFASLGLHWRPNEDTALAAYLGLPGEPRGVFVIATSCGGSADGVLRPRDILLALDRHEIDASGFYRHPRYGQLLFTHIGTEDRSAGERVSGVVWRDGARVELSIELRRASADLPLVPRLREGRRPPYVIEGGLVFRELDAEYLRSWGSSWRKLAPFTLLLWNELFRNHQSAERSRVVILTEVLPHAFNVGYHGLAGVAVREVNGKAIGSLAELDRALGSPEGRFHRIVLHPNGAHTEVVLDAALSADATRAILEEYQVPARLWLEPARERGCVTATR